MAVGILSIAMMLIATMFPVAIYLTSVASERTMAAIVADGAFAKIQLYGVDPCDDPCACIDYENELVSKGKIDPNEFSYPSVDPCTNSRQYYWSALYKFDPNSSGYLVTVFVARKTNTGLTYPNPSGLSYDRPRIITIDANLPTDTNFLNVSYVYPPATIFDNASGRLYRIVDRVDNKVRLDRRWDEDTLPSLPPVKVFIWLVPPPDTGGRNAGIEVYQRIIKF